ncbi:MAG: hypothetical protein ACRDWI_14435 [Jiangellaceae bacterium]
MAAFLRRRQRIGGLELDPGERPLASANTASGPVVATDRRLVIAYPDRVHAVGWEDVERAQWDRDGEVLVVTETAAAGSRPPEHRLRIEEPGRLVDVVRERVNASVVLTRSMIISGERGVRVTGRRRPGQDGLRWVVAVDPGLDLDDPAVRASVDSAVTSVRAEVE